MNMVFHCKLLLALLLPAMCFSYTVRVLLDQQSDIADHSWTITSPQGFLCSNISHPKIKVVFQEDTLNIVLKHGQIICNGKRCLSHTLKIEPVQDSLKYDEHIYQGSLLLIKKNQKIYLINELDIEDYIFGVLRWESWPGWPIEVNKVFAIASRSYVVARILEARKKKLPYHIHPTNIHQTYKGFHDLTYLRQAVDETRGMILTFKNKPIDAMFDVCCGGIIPAHMHGIDFAKAPYLAREYPCTFCKPCKSYSYRHRFSREQLEPLILKDAPHLKKLVELRVVKRDKAGIVQELLARGTGGSSMLSGKQFYSLLTNIKSFCFSVYKKGHEFFIEGKGFGHHLGLCQWGARAMVENGWNYMSILQFYYPGTIMKQLSTKEQE